MKKPMRSVSISIILVLILLLLSFTVAFAAPPLGLHIEVLERIDSNLGPDPFTASGLAVDNGVICPTGQVVDTVINYFGPPQGTYTFIYIVKEFTCDDNSGMFMIKMRVRLNTATGYTTARWHFTNGSGDYSRLRGHGTLVGTPGIPGTILDIYDGVVH
jgi:hypothetical protein